MNRATPTLTVGLNGFGIIGRLIYRLLSRKECFTVRKINEPGFAAFYSMLDIDYLLQHDSVHRSSPCTLHGVQVTTEREAEKMDWKGIDVVIDATPHLCSYAELGTHLQNGAKYVIRTSPFKGDLTHMQTLLPGINMQEMDIEKHRIFSAASCTTNCLAPLVKLIADYCRQKKNEVRQMDFLTVHAYTSDQFVKDGYHSSDPCRGRGVCNIIETETGASKQITVIFPFLEGKIFGSCYRVPVTDGSSLELRLTTESPLELYDFNCYVRQQAAGPLQGIVRYETAHLVSGDCIDDPHSAIYLEAFTRQFTPTRTKLAALYDNEFGYANRVVDLVKEIQRRLNNNGGVETLLSSRKRD